jgi:cytochrome oxidase assembly protein ShyY1
LPFGHSDKGLPAIIETANMTILINRGWQETREKDPQKSSLDKTGEGLTYQIELK